MVPVYYYLYEEGVLVLLCVVGRQSEAASISDFVTFNYVCGLKVHIGLLGGSYPSAASTHRGQVVLVFVCLLGFLLLLFFCFCFVFLFFFCGGGGGGGGGEVWRGGDLQLSCT